MVNKQEKEGCIVATKLNMEQAKIYTIIHNISIYNTAIYDLTPSFQKKKLNF